jgi:amino-acid N-acetyltransferase
VQAVGTHRTGQEMCMPAVTVRPARTADVWTLRSLIDGYSDNRLLLSKPTVTLFETVPDFVVAETAGPLASGGTGTSTGTEQRVVGCAAVHVLWEDLAEVRTLAVDPACRGHGVGRALLDAVLDRARALGVQRLFCLTFAVDFFASAGFVPIGEGKVVDPVVYEQLLESYDEGVAEFLDLERVKPNTLGNTRMLRHL